LPQKATARTLRHESEFIVCVHMLFNQKLRESEPSLANMIIEFRNTRAKQYHIKHYKIISEHISLNQDYNKDDETTITIEYNIKEYSTIRFKLNHYYIILKRFLSK
jgi:hypothetical protein